MSCRASEIDASKLGCKDDASATGMVGDRRGCWVEGLGLGKRTAGRMALLCWWKAAGARGRSGCGGMPGWIRGCGREEQGRVEVIRWSCRAAVWGAHEPRC
jgi:hypothetical protein